MSLSISLTSLIPPFFRAPSFPHESPGKLVWTFSFLLSLSFLYLRRTLAPFPLPPGANQLFLMKNRPVPPLILFLIPYSSRESVPIRFPSFPYGNYLSQEIAFSLPRPFFFFLKIFTKRFGILFFPPLWFHHGQMMAPFSRSERTYSKK